MDFMPENWQANWLRRRWDYMRIESWREGGQAWQRVVELGLAGWELVSVVLSSTEATYFLKRPLLDDEDADATRRLAAPDAASPPDDSRTRRLDRR